jgi:Flp pilus assembly protein TadB
MKFLSLFTKAPANQRFNYTPRYYDQKKEEMKEREDRIRKELEKEKGIVSEQSPANYRSRMQGSFHAARRRSKTGSESNVVLIRLGVLLFIALFVFAFITWGKPALYSLIIFIPIYIYVKMKRRIS